MRFSAIAFLLILGSACSPTAPYTGANIAGTWEGTASFGVPACMSCTGLTTHTVSFSFTQSGSSVTGTWTMTPLAEPGGKLSGTLSGRFTKAPTLSGYRGDYFELDLVSTCSPDALARAFGDVTGSMSFGSMGFQSSVSNCRTEVFSVSLNTR